MHANYSSFQKVAAFRTRESMDETGKGKGGFGMTIWGVTTARRRVNLLALTS